jgi:hypothetical protein
MQVKQRPSRERKQSTVVQEMAVVFVRNYTDRIDPSSLQKNL